MGHRRKHCVHFNASDVYRLQETYRTLPRDLLRPRICSGVWSMDTETRLLPVETLTTFPYDDAIDDLLPLGDKLRESDWGDAMTG